MSLKEIKEGAVCTLVFHKGTYGSEDIDGLLLSLRDGAKLTEFKKFSNFVFEAGKEYKAILIKIRFNNLFYYVNVGTEDKSSNNVPHNKMWAEIFLVEENVKTNIYLAKFQDSLVEIL